MRKDDFCKLDGTLFRILDQSENSLLVINCDKKAMPKWIERSVVSSYCEGDLPSLPDFNDLSPEARKKAHDRFTIISKILPFVTDKHRRCFEISRISEEKGISTQTISTYLWSYLVYQNLSILAPKERAEDKTLTQDEKNMRWALNKYFYTQKKASLNMAYMLMLKEKYCDEFGTLQEGHPSFYQFRYFYRKHKKLQNFYISRNGLRNYQRNNRPLLGDGVQEFANSVGYGMLDATICDIYLINDAGSVVGRPILTACIDAYSGMCCGYALTWEGGMYSLRSLMINTIADKVALCKKHGIAIDRMDWNCDRLPAVLVTDKGKEYASDTFSQLSELGATVVNLPPYRPELKGAVEKFFDCIQNLYKPVLLGKGVIRPDFQERGAYDYRKDSCLSLEEFEKIIVRCILYYNTQRVLERCPYTAAMIAAQVKPHANCIWNYGTEQLGANLIKVDYSTLVLTMLPRTQGKFDRRGLHVNNLRYRNDAYTEQFLHGGTCVVAYDPENVSKVWVLEKGQYTEFSLIERRFLEETVEGISDIKEQQKTLISMENHRVLQARIDLMTDISVVANNAHSKGSGKLNGIRENRRKEKTRTHINYLEEGI